MRLIIGADIVPTKSNEVFFSNCRMSDIISTECMELLASVDYRIVNLEVPLVNEKSPIIKSGPALIANESTVNGLREIGVDYACICNNHIMDQGTNGLISTIRVLEKSGIISIGAGRNKTDAQKAVSIMADEGIVSIYSCCEHEFSVVDEVTPGANPFDYYYTPQHIKELKKKSKYVIVLYHGGKEFYRYPSPDLQKNCRLIIDSGADIVICQHSHCIGCEEKYHDGTIVYGQGNLLFDRGNDEYWNTGLLVELVFSENMPIGIVYHPIKKDGIGVGLADGESTKEIMKGFYERSKVFENEELLKEYYEEFSKKMLQEYLIAISPRESLLFRALNKITQNRLRRWKFRTLYSKERLATILNYIECEAHRELFICGLKKYIGL